MVIRVRVIVSHLVITVRFRVDVRVRGCKLLGSDQDQGKFR